MSTSVNIEEAQVRLEELIDDLAPGDELIITRGNQPIAELHPVTTDKPRPRFGSCKSMLFIVADDDEHLKEFQGYMS